MKTTTEAIARGRKYGIITFALFGLSYILYGSTFLLSPSNKLIAEVINAVPTIALTGTYFIFLLGVLALAKEYSSPAFVTAVKFFIGASTILGVLGTVMAFPSLIAIVPELLTFIVMVGCVILLGIASLRISKHFEALTPKLGTAAHRAAWWNKVTGYLCVSVILAAFGIFASLVADYYMWRVLGEHLKSEK